VSRSHPTLRLAIALALTTGATVTVLAQGTSFGGDKIAFPADFAKGVNYTTVDRADLKQVRELYAPPAVVEEARKGQPLPDGAVLTMLNFKAKVGADGQPVKGADGRHVKDELIAHFVMQKQKGFGAANPAELRNGEWEYRAYKADKSVNAEANLKACYECHTKVDKKDYVFSLEKLAGK